MPVQSNNTSMPGRWSVEGFAAFWSNPDPALVPAALTDDVVGYWPGRDDPVRGKEDYTRCIAAMLAVLPDLRISVAEHAQSGDFFFIRWIM
jgi:SnoaL-like polyketide cyclase